MLPTPDYIETQQALQNLASSLFNESLIAIDTESNNIYVYQERVCLIQISTRTNDYIVDPLAIPDLSVLKPIMEADFIEKVFHGAEYDIVSLKRDFGFTINCLFDTMTAARLCGFDSVGLGNVLHKMTGLQLDKRFQMDNWGMRPLSDSHLRYAQMDTHFLPYLRDEFHKFLEQRGQLEEAMEIFAEIAALPPAPEKSFQANDFWKIGRPYNLKRHEMKVLCALYAWREQTAMEENLPPNKILTNRALIEIARRKPSNYTQLKAIRAINRQQREAFNDAILAAVEAGKQLGRLPAPPRDKRPSPEVSERYAALRSWRRDRASERGVDSDIIVSRHTLWALAYEAPYSLDELKGIDGIGPWRLEHYGEELLDVLHEWGE